MKYRIIGTASVVFVLASVFVCAQITTTITTNTPEFHSAPAQISVQKYNVKPDCEAPCEHCSLRSSYLSAGEVEGQIFSAPILSVVAERLGLAAKWQVNGEELLLMLKGKIQVRQFLSTSLISITVTSQDVAEAAAIANEIAQVFLDDVKEQSRQKKETAQVTADKELKAQEELVNQLKLTLQKLRKEQGLSDSLFVDDEAVQKLRMDALQKDTISTEKAMLAAEVRLKKFSELKDKSMDEFVAFVKDPFIDTLRDQIKQVEKQLSEILPSPGATHPEVKQTQAALDELNEKWGKATDGILKGLRAQCIILKSKFDALNQEIEKVENAQPIIKSPELKRVWAEYDAQKATLDALKKKAFMIKYQRPDLSVEISSRAALRSEPSPEFEAYYKKAIQAVTEKCQPGPHEAIARISLLKRNDQLLNCKILCEHCLLRPSSSLKTEAILIGRSKAVLDPVVQRLNLVEKWAMDGVRLSSGKVRLMLTGKLTVRQVGDSSYIDITARSSDAAEAVAIANEVALAYKHSVEETSQKEMKREAEALARELKGQEDKVQQVELKYKELRKKQGLSEIPVVLDKSQRQQFAEDRIKARVAMLVAKTRMEQISKMESEELVASAAYMNDPSVNLIRLKIVEITKQLSGMDADSPAVQQKQATLNELSPRLESALEDFSKVTEDTYLAAKEKFETLDQKHKAIFGQEEDSETRRARQEFEIQKSISEALKKRVSEMPLIADKPPSCTVKIVSLAQVEESSD